MMHWFTWKGKSSLTDFDLWINKLPKITRAPERYDTVSIPGRAGDLILLEGEDVYDSYVRECTVITLNTNPTLQDVLNWLRGTGDLTFSNEPDRIYTARIVNEVSFSRIGNDLIQAKIQFYCEPFKRSRKSEEKITMTASGTIGNPGNVASKPKVKITATGTKTIVIGGVSMTFNSITDPITVDCDARIVTCGNAIWTGTFSGDFWQIPVGQSNVTVPASTSIEITPNWRWV